MMQKETTLPRNRKVTVKKSQLPGAGHGLFARVDFKKGDRITAYGGRRRPWKEAKAEDGYNGYILRLSKTTVIDALRTRNIPGRYANDAAGPGRVPGLHNNAEYLIYGDRCYIEATRSIRKGEEIFVGYGKAFWALQRKIRKANSR